jgi:hypothetical protein
MSAGTTSWVATSAATSTTTKSSSGACWPCHSARPRHATGPGGGKGIRDLEKEKAQAGIWGVQNQMASLAGGFGSFAKPTAFEGVVHLPGRATCKFQ